jgi:predicted SprT family Zn-dependent metalloprotease
MTLTTDEFMRRFLIHVLPRGFHRIRHYGLFANHVRVKQVQQLRQLLSDQSVTDMRVDDITSETETDTAEVKSTTSTYTCRTCGAPMIIIETFEKQMPRAPPLLS